MIHFVVPRDSEFGIRDYLKVYGLPLAARIAVLHYEDLPARSSLPGGVYLFSALDQLLPRGLRLAGEAARQLAGAGMRVMNHPDRTLRRLGLLEALYRRGLNRHRALRAGADLSSLRYPVFLREEFHHTSALTPLLHTAEELQLELGRAVVRGLPMDELLVVEFCDTADPEGSYRKYAAFVVGSEVLPRSLSHGTNWALKHSGSEFTRKRLDEEREYMFENPHQARLREIFNVAQVEYGRIDYAIKGDMIETWEINLNPTIGRGSRSKGAMPADMREYRSRARDHFYRRFQAAFEAIDLPGAPGAIVVSYPPATLAGLGALARPSHAPRRFESVKRILRPFRPLLDPIVRLMLPLLGRATVRRPRSPGP